MVSSELIQRNLKNNLMSVSFVSINAKSVYKNFILLDCYLGKS